MKRNRIDEIAQEYEVISWGEILTTGAKCITLDPRDWYELKKKGADGLEFFTSVYDLDIPEAKSYCITEKGGLENE